MKFEPIFFPGSLAVFNPKGRADGGVGGGNPPVHQFLGGEIGSNFFVNTPPTEICPVFGQKFQNSPTSFGLKFKFFGFQFLKNCQKRALKNY
jgi:hypothetical protein